MHIRDGNTSQYFERTLFYDPSPATDAYFEQRAKALFVDEKSPSLVGAYSQDRPNQDKKTLSISSHRLDEALLWTNYPSDSDTSDSEYGYEPLPAPDHHKYRRKGPPPYPNGPGLKFQEIENRSSLASFIRASKKKFRIFVIRQRNSYSQLTITRELFERLLFKCHILPRFKEFVLCYGVKGGENEVGPPQLRFRRLPRSEEGEGFECAYGLRFVELNNKGGDKDPWSSRQTVVYHKWKPGSTGRSSTWVLITPSKTALLRLDRYIMCCQDLSAMNPFEIHLVLMDTALANWRPYIVNLTEGVNELADRVVLASVDGRGLVRVVEFEERQRLKQVEDKLLDVKTVLDSTLDTVTSLIEQYMDLTKRDDSSILVSLDIQHDSIVFGLQEKKREVLLIHKKIDVLHAKIQGTMTLLSGLLDLGNGLALKDLAVQARQENEVMRHLTEKGTRDAAAVKVLTVITLIYLPSTVVSNFYSTSFVSKETQGNSTKLVYLDNTWLFWAISVPLTIGTLGVWWIMVKIQRFLSSKKEGSLGYLKTFLPRRRKSSVLKEEGA